MRILVVGAGATGGFYGALLLRAGRDVTFLLRERRAREVREHGLSVLLYQSEPLTVHPRVVTAEELRTSHETWDLIVISTKAYQLEAALDDIAPAVGPQTMLLPILNGMRHLDMLDRRFGADKVLGGSVRVASQLDAEQRIVQLNELDQMSYGERSGLQTERILAVDAALRDAGFPAILQENILAGLWGKWVVLASMGIACILARGTAGEISKAPHAVDFARAITGECAAIAARNGYPQSAELVESHVALITTPGSTMTSSLYRDMVKGAAVEADHILGDLLDRAQGVPAPLLTAAYVQLKVYEAQRSVA